MKSICKKCKVNEIPYTKIIDGKRRNLSNRTSCLTCIPFKHSPYANFSDEERRKRYKARKAKNSRDFYKRYAYKNAVIYSTEKRTNRKNSFVKLFNGCQICGYSRAARNLTFHHLDRSTKKFAISSRSFQFKWERVKREILKCVFVCHNCHGEIHDGLIEQSMVTESSKKLTTLIVPWDFWPYEDKPKPKLEKVSKPRKTKIKWPSNEVILEMLAVASFEAVARKLGVSSNAIRRRLKR